MISITRSVLKTYNMTTDAFKANSIVPDVLDVAPPNKAEVRYRKSKKMVDLGNEMAPVDVREVPEVHYEAEPGAYYTLAMVDPDGPNRNQPGIGEVEHWNVVNIPGSEVSKGETLSEYIGSGPPKGTGRHRYVFLVYQQSGKLKFEESHKSNTNKLARLSFSIAKFAEKYNLGNPIAGNVYKAQYDDSVPELHKQFTS